MPYRLVVGVLALVTAGACAGPPPKRWFKPGSYTRAEFERDVASCTRGRVLDDACMEARGWVAVSPEKPEPAPAQKDVPYLPTPPVR